MAAVEGLNINTSTISNAYKRYYPETFKTFNDSSFMHYLHLWGIRVSTCDTSMPDDLVGGIRLNNLNFLESLVSTASTEPSPRKLAKLHDAEALAKGGAAFVMEGQHAYNYKERNFKQFSPYPSWCPVKPVKVYRWVPTPQDVSRWVKDENVALSERFEADLKAMKAGDKNARVKISTSTDCCIHRTWSKTNKFLADSAGCQVLRDHNILNQLGTWAEEHRRKKYGNVFIYTLFTKDQFLSANGVRSKDIVPQMPQYNPKSTSTTPPASPSAVDNFIKFLFGTK